METRLGELVAANEAALRHIASSGNYLRGDQRVHLAQSAFASLQKPPSFVAACQSSSDELFSVPQYAQHPSFVELFVGTVAHLQSRVSQDWHSKIVRRMQNDYNLLDLPQNEEFAAFGELLVVVAWSIGIAVFCKAANLPMPQFDGPGSSSPPRREPLSDFAEELQTDASVGFSPFITKLKDGHRHDPTWMASFSKSSIPPYVHVALAPVDTIQWILWWEGRTSKTSPLFFV
jgi:hypothetical protein